MIRTSRQLKDRVRNLSGGSSPKAQILIRNYVMGRFLERLSLSPYSNNFILKGGVLVSAILGLDHRSTMDVDATVKNLSLSLQSASQIVREIASVDMEDGMRFEFKKISTITDEVDYPGIRIEMEATLDSMRTPLKIDLTTGDVITPGEITYTYKLLLEDRTISIMAYNLETLLAEKLETVLSRGTANTRMRDFYDIYVLENLQGENIDRAILQTAFQNTCENRASWEIACNWELILDEIQSDEGMADLWENYKRKFDYASEIQWAEVLQSVRSLCEEQTFEMNMGFDLSL